LPFVVTLDDRTALPAQLERWAFRVNASFRRVPPELAVKNFAITGVAGYIAPPHLKAITDTRNRIVAAMDPHDAAGILDRFSMETRFFTEFERFDGHVEMLRRAGGHQKVDYMSICAPNYTGGAHGLTRSG
jgi:hypothetical protein